MMPLSVIDTVNNDLAEMPGALHRISDNNLVRLIDTPHVWGQPMTAAGTANAAAVVQQLASTVRDIIAGATSNVDVVSLNPPSGIFMQAIEDGLKALAAKSDPIVIRFLFGYVPTQDTVAKFTKDLAVLCQSAGLPLKVLTIVVGQYYSYNPPWWNHAKIVAADGRIAVVGGHNLWEAAYATYPPVHDISVEVMGPAAADAQLFAEFLWRNGQNYLVAWQITQIGVQDLPPDKRGIVVLPDTASLRDLGANPRPATSTGNAPGWRVGRTLSLGRVGGLPGVNGNASDVAKRRVISGARQSLRICQQDLLFLGAVSSTEHLVCGWISDALIASVKEARNLQVQIVVSPLDGSGGGDPYSWGSGAIGTYQFLKNLVWERSGKNVGIATTAMSQLHVAPFCFTAVNFKAEGVDYIWPDVDLNKFTGRFGVTVPVPNPISSNPAPGNHAKVYLADDTAYYIGSDNLYPHNLAEFGYLIEGPAVTDFKDNYWDQVWKYSGPHCVTDDVPVNQVAAAKLAALQQDHEDKFPL